MNAHCRILLLLIVVGLVVPTMPVAGDSCRGDSCRLHLRQAAESSSARMDTCCNDPRASSLALARPCHPIDADKAEDLGDDCCSSRGCNCICCGTAVVPALIRSTPIQVTIAPRSATVALGRPVLSPQDAVGALLHPPQS